MIFAQNKLQLHLWPPDWMNKSWTLKSALENGSKEANQDYKNISSDINICMNSEYSFYGGLQ